MKNFVDKDLVNLPENYKDERGFIQPLCDLDMKSASLIFSKNNFTMLKPIPELPPVIMHVFFIFWLLNQLSLLFY